MANALDYRMLAAVRLTLVLLASLGPVGCDSAGASRGGGSIVAESTKIAMGRATAGEIIKGRIGFQNRGESDLVIDKVESSCSCTTTLLSPRVLRPNEIGTVEVRLDTSNLRGAVQREVRIHNSDPTHPVLQVEINATIELEFEVSNGSIDFGMTPVGRVVSRDLMVRVAAGRLSVAGVRSTNEAVAAELLPPSSRRADTEFRIRVTVRPDAAVGQHFGVVIVTTSSQLTPELRIPVFGAVSRVPPSL